MRLRYNPASNAAYIYLTETQVDGPVTTCGCDAPIGGPINLDFDSKGRLIGIEVLQAREKLPEDLLKGARQSNPTSRQSDAPPDSKKPD